MEFRDSFSRLKEKNKHRLTGSRPKPDKPGAEVGGDSVDSKGSRPGSESHLVAGSRHDQEGSGAITDEGQVVPTIQFPQLDEPGSAPIRGSVNDKGKRGEDVDRGEVKQTHSQPPSADVNVAEGSGPAEGKDVDAKRVYPSPFTTLIQLRGVLPASEFEAGLQPKPPRVSRQ
jgi:hypothetical protein